MTRRSRFRALSEIELQCAARHSNGVRCRLIRNHPPKHRGLSGSGIWWEW